MSETLIGEVVPAFESVEDLQAALVEKNDFGRIDLYPRDGTVLLSETEERIAELTRVGGDELVLCVSGMAAVVGAIEASLGEDTRTVAFPEQAYSQTGRYASEYLAKTRGIKTVRFDSGSTTSIDSVLRRHQPDIVVAETVGNGPDVPVLDLGGLFGLQSLEELQPTVILDNTLPLSTRLPLGDILEKHPNVLGVESGTKSYTFNQELCGFVYGKNADAIHRVRQYRRTVGITPNVAGIQRVSDLLPASLDEFDQRNRAIFGRTSHLAEGAYVATKDSSKFIVSHPCLPNHPNSRSLSEASTPVFFIQCIGEEDQFDLTRRLWSQPVIREECELGQSFGFDKTRILPNESYPCVRIAGGANSEIVRLGEAFHEALSD